MADAHDGRAVANFVLDQCERLGVGLTNLALQKVVYFCHVWTLVALRKPLIRHSFEAWEFGPVLPYLYREFRAFDRAPIRSRATRIDPSTGGKLTVPYRFEADVEGQLRQTVSFYGRMRAGDLVEMSHVEGGPWHQVWNHPGLSNPGMQIDDQAILKFYSRVRCPSSIQ